jgi:bile acid:Na+ symporter, BASS family
MILGRGLVVWLVLFSLVALKWPVFFGQSFDPFVASAGNLDLVIAVTMFAIGALLPQDEVQTVLRRWPTVLSGTIVQYLSMPLLAYCIARGFGFEGPYLTGIVMAGCVPGAMASNVLSLIARANVSYSVGLTTSATLLSPLMVPLAMKLTLGQWQTFPFWTTAFTLVKTVVGPVLLGYLVARLSRRFESVARWLAPVVANLSILWIIAVVVALNRDRLTVWHGTLIVALLLLNLGGYLAGFLGGALIRLPDSMRRALTLEVGMQNAGLGTVLVLKLFGDQPETAIPTALYTFGCMLTGTLLANLWSFRTPLDFVENTGQIVD